MPNAPGECNSQAKLLFAHDLYGKPLHSFADHAPVTGEIARMMGQSRRTDLELCSDGRQATAAPSSRHGNLLVPTALARARLTGLLAAHLISDTAWLPQAD